MVQALKKNHRFICRACACAAATAILLSGCSSYRLNGTKNNTAEIIGKVDSEALKSNRFTHADADSDRVLPQLSTDGFSLVAENDWLALYLREQYASIRVVDKKTGYVWGALPEDIPEDLNEMWALFGNSVVSLECIDSTGMTKQTSAGQADALRSYDMLADGFRCTVDFGDESEITLTVSVRLKDSHLEFSVDDSSIREEGSYYINKLYFAPFFGCTHSDDTDGYIFIPDGCGALMRYQKPMQVLRAYSERVYGLDQAIDNLSELNDLDANRPNEFLTASNTVTMPVYGLTHGVKQQALFGRIKSGAEYASIEATPAGFISDYNWAAASFIYRQTYLQPTSKSGSGVPILQKNRNSIDPVLELYFLNGSEADYNGMASLYSNILSNEGMLKNNQSENAPVIALDIVAADAEQALIGHTTKTVTSGEYTLKAVESLHSSGIERLAVSVLGWQKGGLNGYSKSEIFNKTVWGSFSALDALKRELDTHNGRLYFYIDPLRAKEIQINARRDSAIGMSQNPISVKCVDTERFLGDVWYIKGTAALNNLLKQSNVITESGGFVTVDGTHLLYGEYLSDHFVSRTEMKNLQEETYGKLAESNGALMLYNPNDYLLKYTGVYRNIPMSGNQDIFETDSVPFLQLVLSGRMRLMAPYANASFYSKTDLLKCMEYNVYPSFLITEKPSSELSRTTLWTVRSSQFEQWEEMIRELTLSVSGVLKNVEGERMLRHTVVSSGVYAVTYESGTIYVNYGSKAYDAGGGISIPAESGQYVPFSAAR